jgi:hypothetical protein
MAPPHTIPLGGFSRLDFEAFRGCFMRWIDSIAELTQGEVVALDGKTLRRSYDRADQKSALHMVSAWASEFAARRSSECVAQPSTTPCAARE